MLTVTKSGDITSIIGDGVLGIASNSSEKWFDIWCDWFYFSIASRQPFSTINNKEYVHGYLYSFNPFGKRIVKIIYFGKFIFIVELDSYACNRKSK